MARKTNRRASPSLVQAQRPLCVFSQFSAGVPLPYSWPHGPIGPHGCPRTLASVCRRRRASSAGAKPNLALTGRRSACTTTSRPPSSAAFPLGKSSFSNWLLVVVEPRVTVSVTVQNTNSGVVTRCCAFTSMKNGSSELINPSSQESQAVWETHRSGILPKTLFAPQGNE